MELERRLDEARKEEQRKREEERKEKEKNKDIDNPFLKTHSDAKMRTWRTSSHVNNTNEKRKVILFVSSCKK